MRIKLHSILVFCLLSVFFIANAYARPSFGGDCSVCHIAPTVIDFQLPASHDSLTVPISSFTATDSDNQLPRLAGVTGYLVTTSSAPPDSSDPGWTASPPAQYTFASQGSQTLYAWAKDTIGNISAAVSGTVDILLAVNTPPVADAGPDQTVDEGLTVILNGSNSDDSDDGIKSYFWEQIGSGMPVTISDPTAEQPTFTAPDVGPGGVALTFRLTVTDNSNATASDTCIVNVSWINLTPVADAGPDQTVPEGTTVTLDGTASSGVDDAVASYLWEQVDATGTLAVLSDPTAAAPEFTIADVGPNDESLTFQLTVTDQGGLQATDRCVVNITNSNQAPVNQAPVADAGGDQVVAIGAQVSLDASGSSDPDGDALTYTWKQIAGTPVTLTSPGAVAPAFTAPNVAAGSNETLTFELTVTDAGQLQSTDTCDVQVMGQEPPPADDPPVVEPPADEPPVVQPPVDDDENHDGNYEDDDDPDGSYDENDDHEDDRRGHHRRHRRQMPPNWRIELYRNLHHFNDSE